MNNIKRYFVIILSVIFIVNLCGCGKDQIKTVKKTTVTPVTEYKTRVVGQRIIGEEVYSDENENGVIDDFEDDTSSTGSDVISSESKISCSPISRSITRYPFCTATSFSRPLIESVYFLHH